MFLLEVQVNRFAIFLRDVGEDARRGRIYLPQDELAQAGLLDDDVLVGKVTDRWRYFTKNQIERARMFYDEAEKGVAELNAASGWPVWASLLLYRLILDERSKPTTTTTSQGRRARDTKKT
ncbi:hypothetical protein NL676_028209 [Syzygium grande]|nr:hypothetical protein NL676_028209 [Syzygium grande]